MLPFRLSGQIAADLESGTNVTVESLLNALSARLEREKPSKLTRCENRLDFTGGIFRPVSSWNQLVAVSRGSIMVVREAAGFSIRYDLWFTQFITAVTIAVGAIFGPFVSSAPNLTVMAKVAVLGGAWLWLAGGNIALTAVRFPLLLRRAAKRSLEEIGQD